MLLVALSTYPQLERNMKVKFERQTMYKHQLFLAGKEYDIKEIDAKALGFDVPAKKAAKTTKAKEAKKAKKD